MRQSLLVRCGVARGKAGYRHLEQVVVRGGFQTDVLAPEPTEAPEPVARAQRLVSQGKNVLFTGPDNTHKFASLLYLGRRLERKGSVVAWTSVSTSRASQFGGELISHFLGLRSAKADVIVDQAVGSIERFTRINAKDFANSFPSVENSDVLIIDGLHAIPVSIVLALDQAARRIRNRPKLPFGGMQVLASANFFRIPHVTPMSPNNGYLFQVPQLRELFDVVLTAGLERDGHLEPFQSKKMRKLTWAALMGTFGPDQVQQMSATAKKSKGKSSAEVCLRDSRSVPKNIDPITHRAISASPLSKHFSQTLFGMTAFKQLTVMAQPSTFRFLEEGRFNVGSRVRLTHDMKENGKVILPMSSPGTIVESTTHYVRVQFDALSLPTDVRPLRVRTSLTDYPNLHYISQQIPLVLHDWMTPRVALMEVALPPDGIKGDAVMTETNSVGNLFSRFSQDNQLQIPAHQIMELIRQEGMVHEPTRIFYEQLAKEQLDGSDLNDVLGLGDSNSATATSAPRWCKNCKSHIPTAEFFSHWTTCVETVRWCSDCSKTIELPKWDAHHEKHTIVLCFDCGKALQWRQWEQHRLSCEGLLKELSAENPLLPLSTRHLVLEQVHSRSDLNTVASVKRQSLPKHASDVKYRTRVQKF